MKQEIIVYGILDPARYRSLCCKKPIEEISVRRFKRKIMNGLPYLWATDGDIQYRCTKCRKFCTKRLYIRRWFSIQPPTQT